jgi:hypothetical protein
MPHGGFTPLPYGNELTVPCLPFCHKGSTTEL